MCFQWLVLRHGRSHTSFVVLSLSIHHITCVHLNSQPTTVNHTTYFLLTSRCSICSSSQTLGLFSTCAQCPLLRPLNDAHVRWQTMLSLVACILYIASTYLVEGDTPQGEHRMRPFIVCALLPSYRMCPLVLYPILMCRRSGKWCR